MDIHELHSHVPEWVLIVIGCAALLLNLLFALGVLRDASRRQDRGHELLFAGPIVWFFGVLFGSFLVLALYWLMHHSSLSASTPKSGEGK